MANRDGFSLRFEKPAREGEREKKREEKRKEGGRERGMIRGGEGGAQKPFTPLLRLLGGGPISFKTIPQSEEREGGRERAREGTQRPSSPPPLIRKR